jgi:glutamyl-tRNA synthetase
MGFPIFPLTWTDPATQELATGFKETGFLPEALINFLAFLGWNPGTEKEIFSLSELVEAFSIERIGKAGAKFDIQKAQWFNQHYLRSKSDKELAEYLLAALAKEGITCSHEKAEKICFALRERITFPHDLWEQGKIFFSAPTTFDQQIVAKKWNLDAVRTLRGFIEEIKVTQLFSADAAKLSLEKVTGELGIKTGQILQPLRMSLTGGASGPDLMLTMEILGKEETVNRIKYALENLQVAGT